MLSIVIAGLVALASVLVLTPVCRNLFVTWGVVDQPDNVRKLHCKRIPRTGGIAVLASYALSLVVYSSGVLTQTSVIAVALSKHTYLLLGIVLIFFVGLADDLVGLRPKQKLLGQILAASLACADGLSIQLFHNPVIDNWTAPVLTVTWLVLCTNAFNLIDGLDGLASGVGLFATVTMALAAVRDENKLLLLMTVPLAGCLLGFLRYNFNPASVFLGDCGSLTIGFLLGCFGTMWSEKIVTWVGLSAPVMALSVPLLDTGISILRRTLRNRPIFSADRGHIHHRLLDKGISVRQAATCLYGACAVAALFSLAQQALGGVFSNLLLIGFGICALWGVRYLGYIEFSFLRRLVANRTLFQLVDDQVVLHSLQGQLKIAGSVEEALGLILPACRHFGFDEVFETGASEYRSYRLEFSRPCLELCVPTAGHRALILRGTPDCGRPVPLEQLFKVVKEGLDRQVEPLVVPEAALIEARLSAFRVTAQTGTLNTARRAAGQEQY